jgi:YVTN family beta-propeller protein
VTNVNSNIVSVIDTATNTVMATVPVGSSPQGIAVTPDGKHAYVANGSVSVIDTATNKVVATVPVGSASGGASGGVTITPDGRHAYAADAGDNTVSVIDTASNTVVATVPVGIAPIAVAVTPDGKYVYVANNLVPTVSVIDTASNTVVATVGAGNNTPNGVGIVPPPPGVPFLAFSTTLDIAFGTAPNQDSFNLHSPFTLSSTAPVLHPHRDPVTLQIGTFSITVLPGSFREQPDGSFTFAGVINGVSLKAQITPTATLQYAFHAKAQGVSLTGTTNAVYVTLTIGGDSGATSVTALIKH